MKKTLLDYLEILRTGITLHIFLKPNKGYMRSWDIENYNFVFDKDILKKYWDYPVSTWWTQKNSMGNDITILLRMPKNK